jgi:hypothetical protein
MTITFIRNPPKEGQRLIAANSGPEALFETSQLAGADPDAMLVAHPSNVFQSNTVLAMDPKRLRTREGLLAIAATRRFQYKVLGSISIHCGTSFISRDYACLFL